MKIIDPFFQKLKPTIEYLSNEVIIAQAWKKTHTYMRTHNWYADTLALDVSALGLESNAVNWAIQVGDDSARLYPMELIPAAKSEEWTVDPEKGWIPKSSAEQKCEQLSKCLGKEVKNCPNPPEDQYCKKDKLLAELRKENPPLRPLAHLTVRDQTWATAAMLCLADVVESAQGDCSEHNFLVARSKNVYSYGNRLLCDWEGGAAWFRWGNSQTYRKFFTDYQKFLKRPVVIGREVTKSQDDTDRVYVVSLDIKRFYDNVDKNDLSNRLQKLCEKNGYDYCEEFWNSFNRITNWNWDDYAHKRAKELNLKLGEGLPQGLVSSGFFANAYMLNFDQKVGEQIHQTIPGSNGIVLHDYCRYVDDLRLVVSIDDDDVYKEIGDRVNTWIINLLYKHAGQNLELNRKKTCITSLSDLDNLGSLSERVNQLQHELSGPADRDILESSMGVLEGLLTTPVEEWSSIATGNDAGLIRLVKFDHDVRSDTLKRFAANRLETIMRNKRRMTESLQTVGGNQTSSIDNESELIAKKLVWAWMKDPSLALVLRKAIEIYPSPTILEPALSAIFRRCSFVEKDVEDKISAAMADYLLADMFRCCSDFHGYFQHVDYPVTASPNAVLAVACQFAQKTMSFGDSLPTFLKRQALLLLAILQKPAPFEYDEANKNETIQDSLHRILAGKQPPWHPQRFALYEVAAQITNTPDIIASLLLEAAEKKEPSEQKRLVDELAKRGGPFWVSFWKCLKKSKIKKYVDEYKWAAPALPTSPQKVHQRLSTLLHTTENPFVHESALIKLALSLLQALKVEKFSIPCSPSQIEIRQDGKLGSWIEWSDLWRPERSIVSKKSIKQHPFDERFEIPKWIEKDIDSKTLYWLGSILRAVVVGTADFTGNRWKPGKTTGYKGLRTGWYKRRMGMMHAPEALVGEYATISQWTSELMMKCLQWPGFESTHISHDDIKNIESVEQLNKVLKNRLNSLDALYCKASDLPTLITRVKRPDSKRDKPFRIVTIQSLLPNKSSFSKADPTLSNENTKAINRDHLARICQITYKTLQAKLKTEEEQTLERYSCSDLIVFPEIAVHPDDQDLLKRLADKTKSMILAGLVFVNHNDKLVNLARWFLPDYRQTGRQWMIRDQGKKNPTSDEKKLGIQGFRPCQHIIEVEGDSEGPFKLTGAICYDSTDLNLVSDLKGKTDLFIILAHNRDVTTFDAMATALHYHMYQHVVVVNKGEFGGTTIQAPYKEQYDRLISHVHGIDQIAINVADLDLAAFKRKHKHYKAIKTPPANLL